MGSKMGIPELTDTQEMVLLKMWRYALRIDNMVKNYANAKDIAIRDYSDYAKVDERKKFYSGAWETMPEVYKTRMTQNAKEILRKWVYEYALNMFGVKLSSASLDTAVSKIIEEAKKISTATGLPLPTGLA